MTSVVLIAQWVVLAAGLGYCVIVGIREWRMEKRTNRMMMRRSAEAELARLDRMREGRKR